MSGFPQHPCREHSGAVEDRRVGDTVLSVIRMPPRFHLPRHSHASAGFALTLQGEGVESYGGAAFHCTPGSLLFQPPEAAHSDQVAEAGLSVFAIRPSPAWVNDVSDYGAVFAAPELAPARERVSALAAQVYHESRRPDAATPLSVQALLFEMAACLVRRNDGDSARAPGWLRRVRARLDDTYAETLSLAELAREAGVHSVHLARSFRQHYGTSVGRYLRRRRIEAAARALRAGDAPLVDIALDAGFTSQAHFCTQFRRLMGCSPGQYRRAAR